MKGDRVEYGFPLFGGKVASLGELWSQPPLLSAGC